jgi:hypothetical protein
MEQNQRLFPAKLLRELGREGYEKNKHRGTGRTTSEALRIISEAMIAPNTEVDLIDRTGPDSNWYRRSHFPRVVSDTIEKLGLNHLRVGKGKNLSANSAYTLTYKINI